MTMLQQSSSITANPLDRVPDVMKPLLSDPNVFFDIHCHVFNYKDVPDGFLGIRLPFNDRFLAKAEKILHSIISRSDTDPLSNTAYFINIFRTRTHEETTKKFSEYYPNVKLILTPLMMDMRWGIHRGEQIVDFNSQIETMKELRNKYPGLLLPFLATDPNNPDVKKNFLKVFSSEQDYKFFGVKIYPSLGYLPAHPTLMEIFEVCEAKKIPVTTHCSGATVHSTRKHIQNIQGWRYDNNGNITNQPISKWFWKKSEYADFFNHPKNWEPVLNQFPNLKLNLAHFGGGDEWDKYCKGKSDTWVSRILDMISRYPNLYTDFSYTFHNRTHSQSLKTLITENALLSSRVLYGSDYYMVVREGHFRNIKINFTTMMGDALIKKLAVDNPKKFLFG